MDIVRSLKRRWYGEEQEENPKKIKTEVVTTIEVKMHFPDSKSFPDFVKEKAKIIIFWHARFIQGNLEKMQQDFADLAATHTSMAFGEVNICDQPDLAKSEGVNGAPVYTVYQNGAKLNLNKMSTLDALKANILDLYQ